MDKYTEKEKIAHMREFLTSDGWKILSSELEKKYEQKLNLLILARGEDIPRLQGAVTEIGTLIDLPESLLSRLELVQLDSTYQDELY